jgi:hypothetical protein
MILLIKILLFVIIIFIIINKFRYRYKLLNKLIKLNNKIENSSSIKELEIYSKELEEIIDNVLFNFYINVYYSKRYYSLIQQMKIAISSKIEMMKK